MKDDVCFTSKKKTLAKTNNPQCFSSLRKKEIKHPTANGSLVSWNDPGLAPHCWAVFLAMSRSVWNGPSPIRPRNHGRLDVACVTWVETWSRFTPRNRRQKWFYHEAPTTKHRHVFFRFQIFQPVDIGGIFNDVHGMSQRWNFGGISGMVIFDLSIWLHHWGQLVFLDHYPNHSANVLAWPYMFWMKLPWGTGEVATLPVKTFVVYIYIYIYFGQGLFFIDYMTVFAGIKQTMQSYGNFEGFSF